jgi:peroxiredoxin
MKTILAFVILLTSFIFASAQTEQAPIQEKNFNYKDWTYKSISDGKEINLREFAKNKKLVLVVYFAPWCPNWKHEAPFAQKLYEKYKTRGLDVIGVGEYDTVAAMKNSIDFFKITFPVVYESEANDARQKTLHYEYRKETGDTRKWGSPWNLFIEPAKLSDEGDTLTKQAFIANGELIEPEAEKFIREKLGLPAEEMKAGTTKKSIEICPEEKTAEFQKP